MCSGRVTVKMESELWHNLFAWSFSQRPDVAYNLSLFKAVLYQTSNQVERYGSVA